MEESALHVSPKSGTATVSLWFAGTKISHWNVKFLRFFPSNNVTLCTEKRLLRWPYICTGLHIFTTCVEINWHEATCNQDPWSHCSLIPRNVNCSVENFQGLKNIVTNSALRAYILYLFCSRVYKPKGHRTKSTMAPANEHNFTDKHQALWMMCKV